MALTFTCQPAFSEYAEAHLHHHRRQVIAVSVILLALGTAAGISRHNWWFLVALIAYVFVLRPWIMRRSLRRIWNRAPEAIRAETTYELDDTGLHRLDEDGERATTPWKEFIKVRESSRIFLLYLTPRLFSYLPKRCLDPTQQQQVRRLLREHIGPRLPDKSML